jgi:hypothetical protein
MAHRLSLAIDQLGGRTDAEPAPCFLAYRALSRLRYVRFEASVMIGIAARPTPVFRTGMAKGYHC